MEGRRETDRQTDRQRQRETETDRDRETERETETDRQRQIYTFLQRTVQKMFRVFVFLFLSFHELSQKGKLIYPHNSERKRDNLARTTID